MKLARVLQMMLILALLASCNLPTAPTSTLPAVPDADLTVTALFKTAVAPPPTETPGPAVATITQAVPSNTSQASEAPSPSALPTLGSSDTPVPTTAFTPTAVPTLKPPPATATVPFKRGGTSAEAAFMDPAPIIDGDWSEWKTAAHEYPAQNVVFGKSNWSGEDDLNASYYVGWDAKYLYVAVKVRDDKYVQLASGANIYKGDSVELLIDTNVRVDYYVQSLNIDDFQIGLAPGRPTIADANPEAYLWFPSAKAGSLSNVKIGAVDEGSVWRLEAAVPWSVLGVTPDHGMHLGFALSVSDNDKAGEQVQQSMVSSVVARHLTDPTSWGDLLLK
jgi:hypothetical protein